MRSIAVFFLLAGALQSQAIATDNGSGLETPPPSILLVTIDTLRADHVGCYGYELATTENIDRLAAEGIRFDEARSHVPLTLPSHATLLTGLLPPRSGIRGNGLFHLDGEISTVAEELRLAGYDTAAVVSSVVLDRVFGLDRGFRVYDDNQRVGSRSTFDYKERGASQVVAALSSILPTLEPPFFLWVHLYDPHAPYTPPESYAKRHEDRPYDGEVAFADDAFGRIWEAASSRSGDNLTVLLSSDHGESLGDHGERQHGYTLHRGVLRVPLIIAGAQLPTALVVSETVGLQDVAPTILALAGRSISDIDGRNLARFWQEDTDSKDESAIIWEETLHPLYDSGWAPLRGVLTPDWHLVDAPRPQLYDRRVDPDDRLDIALEKPEMVARLSSTLSAIALELGDVREPAGNLDGSDEARRVRAELESLGYLSGAASTPREGPRLDPKDGLPGWLAIEDASRFLAEGKASEARAALEPHLRKDRFNPRLWNKMGGVLALLSEGEKAEIAFRRAIDLDGESEYVHTTFASFLVSEGRFDEAAEQWGIVLTRNPRAVDAILGLVDIALRLGDEDRVDELLADSYAIGVRDPVQLMALGFAAKSRGQFEQASIYFRESLELDPGNASARLESARDLLRRGSIAPAVKELDACIDSERAFECRMELARAVMMGSGDLREARRLMLFAGEVARHDSQAQEVIDRVREIDRSLLGRPPSR